MLLVRERSFLRSLSCAALAVGGLALIAGSALAQKIVPPGFTVELLAAPPEIEHPSVVTCDPDGNLYVGEDPMDMRGPTTAEFDRVLLFRWDRQTGKPVKTVFCDKLAAVFGLVWHEGALYVLHAPHYTRFRDTDGDGVADERKELADGFGPAAGVFGFNDHIVTGTRMGLDGLIYVSVGDKGIPKATGSDGSTITLEGGGVVRMRPDGSQLEIVSSGTRNHLDVAMDSLDNIFTYDNTDDGAGWWTRFTHHVPTGYYGYPYDYHPHPDRHLPRISEHGGGSPVGAACYTEAAWPAEFRENAFHCEWGKGKIQRFKLTPSGATFTATIDDFMVKQDGTAEEFRPQDLCFSPDGKHMYVADWNYGGWLNKKVHGRLYRVTYTGGDVPPEPARASDTDPLDAQIRSLGHPARSERMRAQWALSRLGAASHSSGTSNPTNPAIAAVSATLLGGGSKMAKIHALWTENQWIDRLAGYDPSSDWIKALQDADADVRSQAARALGLRRVKGALQPLVAALGDSQPTVRMWAAIALGRLADKTAAESLFAALSEQDVFARFAMIQALRAINEWTLAGKYLASPSPDVRTATLLALTGVYEDAAVSALAAAAKHSPDEATRAGAVSAIAEVHHKAAPYVSGWWGTRPAAGKPARPKNIDWSGTTIVMLTLREALVSPHERARQAALEAFKDIRDPACETLFVELAGSPTSSESVRLSAIEWFTDASRLGDAAKEVIAKLVKDPGQPVAVTLKTLDCIKAQRPHGPADQPVEALLSDARPPVRAKAIQAFVQLKGAGAGPAAVHLLADQDAEVRRAAIQELGDLKFAPAIAPLLKLAGDAAVYDDLVAAVLQMPDRRALSVYLDALQSKNSTIRDKARSTMAQIRDVIGDDVLELSRHNELPRNVLGELQAVFDSPAPIVNWKLAGSWSKDIPLPTIDWASAPNLAQPLIVGGKPIAWRDAKAEGLQGRVSLHKLLAEHNDVWAVAYANFHSDADTPAQFLLGSDDQVVLWVNGQKIVEYLDGRGWNPESQRGSVHLRKGDNHIWMLVGNGGGYWEYSLALGSKNAKFASLYDNAPAKLDTGAYRDFAAKSPGDAARGRALFYDVKGIGCVKCHAVGGEGSKIGPDLIGVGAKYPREELIRSVLEPSNRVLDGYRLTTIVTDSGKTLQGIVRGDSPDGLELLDAEGRVTRVPAGEIEERHESTLSLMPNGLKDGMTLENFADLVAYLESLKEAKK